MKFIKYYNLKGSDVGLNEIENIISHMTSLDGEHIRHLTEYIENQIDVNPEYS